MDEIVVLVNQSNVPIGTMPKLAAHNSNTPLHRGFSLFLFNSKGQLLLQQRSKKKKTWPLVWSNSVCGHPMLDELPNNAAERRLTYELGIQQAKISIILPDYRYRFMKDGIVENECCPVMVGISNDKPIPNPDEVQATKWISWQNWLGEVNTKPDFYSPWCVEETQLLHKNKKFSFFLQKLN